MYKCKYYKTKTKSNILKHFKAHRFVNVLVNISTVLAAIFSFLIFINLGNLTDLKNSIKEIPHSPIAINEWKEELSCLKIDVNREYVEDIIGKPKLTKDHIIEKSKYRECIYNNSYFTLHCFYDESFSLIAFLIIGNDKEFNYKNYRCTFSLFDYSINEAESFCFNRGVQSYIVLKNNFSQRLDANSYYFECNFQHSRGATNALLIGYGICDTGYIESYDDFYEVTSKMSSVSSFREQSEQEMQALLTEPIRSFPINLMFVMKDLDNQKTNSFIDNCIARNYAIGINRDEYANLQSDYENCIDKYSKYLKHK